MALFLTAVIPPEYLLSFKYFKTSPTELTFRFFRAISNHQLNSEMIASYVYSLFYIWRIWVELTCHIWWGTVSYACTRYKLWHVQWSDVLTYYFLKNNDNQKIGTDFGVHKCMISVIHIMCWWLGGLVRSTCILIIVGGVSNPQSQKHVIIWYRVPTMLSSPLLVRPTCWADSHLKFHLF